MKRFKIYEGHEYVNDTNWVFQLDDDKSRRFGLHIETINMAEATGEPEFEDYPYLVSFQIVADKVHKSFNESNEPATKLNLLMDCIQYMGGVPIDHKLANAIKAGSEVPGDAFEVLAVQFTASEAKVVVTKPTFGSVAAQQGPGAEFKYLQFKTEESAAKYVNYILANRVQALGVMIGFMLDAPINMIGETGWSVIENQVRGCKSRRKVA
jgi:hypothetical protein